MTTVQSCSIVGFTTDRIQRLGTKWRVEHYRCIHILHQFLFPLMTFPCFRQLSDFLDFQARWCFRPLSSCAIVMLYLINSKPLMIILSLLWTKRIRIHSRSFGMSQRYKCEYECILIFNNCKAKICTEFILRHRLQFQPEAPWFLPWWRSTPGYLLHAHLKAKVPSLPWTLEAHTCVPEYTVASWKGR